MLTYDKAPRNATGWPVSGKYAQDSIVCNLMGLDAVEPTAPDYAQTQFVNEQVMNDGAKLRGFPPLDQSNPIAAERNIVGGIHLRGYSRGYENSNGTIGVDGPDDDVTNPAPPSGGDDDGFQGTGGYADGSAVAGDAPSDGSALGTAQSMLASFSPTPGFWVFVLAIAVFAWCICRKKASVAR